MILQTNPKANYLARKDEIDKAIADALASGWYILGEQVKQFEAEFAAFVGSSHSIGVANGTDAIEIALRAVGVECGDLVFTVGHTAIATVVGVERSGAVPVLVDIDPVHFTMCPVSLENAIRAAFDSPGKYPGKPAAVVAVHLYGQTADVQAISAVAKKYGLKLVEDCAQCHGAFTNLVGSCGTHTKSCAACTHCERGTVGRRLTGSVGDAAAFSFYPTKNLGAIGDGGAVVSSDPAVAERARQIREYGWKQRYVSAVRGCNSRLDELQAALLRVKLRYLGVDNQSRIDIAGRYRANLPAANCPVQRPGLCHVYHQFVLSLKDRDAVQARLKELGVGSLIHYPVPAHVQDAYRTLPQPVPLTATEEAARRVLSLPMYPELTADQVGTVIDAVQRSIG